MKLSGPNELRCWFVLSAALLLLTLGVGCDEERQCRPARCVWSATFVFEYSNAQPPTAVEVCRGDECFVVDNSGTVGFDGEHETERVRLRGQVDAGTLRLTLESQNGRFVEPGGEQLRLTLFSAEDELASKEWMVEVREWVGICPVCWPPTQQEYR